MNLDGGSRDWLFLLSMMRAVSSYSAFFSLSSLSNAYTSPLVSSTLKMVLAYSPSIIYLALLFLTLDVIQKESIIQRDKSGLWYPDATQFLPEDTHDQDFFRLSFKPEQPSRLLMSAAVLLTTTAAASMQGDRMKLGSRLKLACLYQETFFFRSYLVFPKDINCSCS